MPWVNELLCRIQFQDHRGVESLLQAGTPSNRQHVDDPVPLLVAIDNSDLQMVKLLLDHGAIVNIQDSNGESPLHYTTQDSVEYEVLDKLLQAGANVNCLNKWKRTALHYVCYGGDLNKMELLLNIPGVHVNSQDEDGNTCLHALMTYDEGEEDDVEFWKRGLSMLLESDVDVNITNRKGQTVLHMAARHQFQSEMILSVLLTKGDGFHFEVQDPKGNNFLLSYINHIRQDRNFLCKLLKEEFQSFHSLPQGFVKEIINMEDKNGQTPFLSFLFGSSHFDLEILQHFVVAGGEVNKPNGLKSTPLHRIMMSELIANRLSACQILIDGGADTKLKDEFGITPIFWARTAKQVGLICDSGADVEHRDKFGRNALMNLTFPRTQEAVEELVARGCNVNAVDMNGATPLHYAVWIKDVELIETLVKVGGDCSLADKENRTPLMLAELLHYTKPYESLEKHNLSAYQKDAHDQKEPVEVIYDREKYFSCKPWPGNELTINHEDIVKGAGIIDALEMQQCNGSVLAKHLMIRPGSGKLFDNPETEQVIDTVQRLITKLSKRISQRDPRFKNDIIQMGSMREGTKTGYPDEFDFVCCLSDILGYCEIENDKGPRNEGFVRMKLKKESGLPNGMENFFDGNGYFKTKDVRLELFELIWNILLEKEMWQDGKILYVGEDDRNGWDQKPVLNFQIVWISQIFKSLKISVDCVPAIRVNTDMADFPCQDSSNTPQEENALKKELFLLLHPPEEIRPKARNIVDQEWDDTLFIKEFEYDNELNDLVNSRLRVSCAPMEVAFLESLPKVTRESYILAKVIRNQCPKVRFNEDFFEDLYMYERNLLRASQRPESLNIEPAELDENIAVAKTPNEAIGSDKEGEENNLAISIPFITEQKAESTSSLDIQSSFSDEASDQELQVAFDSSDNVEEQKKDAGNDILGLPSTDNFSNGDSPIEYLLSEDTEDEAEDASGKVVHEADDIITSYMLKNALFHLVGKHPELCDPDLDRNTSEERWRITLELTIEIFKYLKDVSDTGEFPVYFLPRQDIFKFFFEFCRTMDQEEQDSRITSYGKRRNVFIDLILTILRAS